LEKEYSPLRFLFTRGEALFGKGGEKEKIATTVAGGEKKEGVSIKREGGGGIRQGE